MTKELGLKTGKLLIFGGAYSNLHALQALQVEAQKHEISPENIICTGDQVGYCAFPNESVLLIKEWGIHSIAGNVEFNLREEADDCGCNFEEGSRCDVLSRQWFPFAQAQMTAEAMEYLHSLPAFINFQYNGKRYFVLHGSFQDTSEFIFNSTPWNIKQDNFLATQSDVILAGHCGLPFLQTKEEQQWINAGVIGMPANDGTPDTWYVILENEKVEFHRLTYDNQAAHDSMLQRPLPKSYAQTLVDGIWDNCDILPVEETNLQGQRIAL